VIRDSAGTQFLPNRERRAAIIEILGVDLNSLLVSIPLPDLNLEHIRVLTSIAHQLDQSLSRKLVFIIFGNVKGRTSLEAQLENQIFQNVVFRDFGMYTDAYSQIMGASDLGICFQGSHQGLDASPELISMAACRLPILALRYGCVGEYVKDGQSGFFFTDESTLLDLLNKILIDRSVDLEKLRENCDSSLCDWETGWIKVFGRFS
jgi:hypothetical protein